MKNKCGDIIAGFSVRQVMEWIARYSQNSISEVQLRQVTVLMVEILSCVFCVGFIF